MWSKKKIAALIGSGAALVMGLCLALGPVCRGRAEKAAERYGMSVEVGHVWPALGGARLTGVRFRSTEAPWLEGELGEVEVRLGWGLGVRLVRAEGGRIALTGTADEITDHLRSLRAKTAPSGEPSSEAHDGSAIEISKWDLRWAGIDGPSSLVELDGIKLERSRPDGGVSRGLLGIEQIRVERQRLRATARKLATKFVRDGKKTLISEAHLGSMDLELVMGSPGPAAPSAPPPSTPINAVSPGQKTAGQGKGTSAPKANAAPNKAATTPNKSPVPSLFGDDWLEQAKRLSSLLQQSAASLVEHLEDGASVEASGLVVHLVHGEQKLNVGPGSLHIAHSPSKIEVEFAPGQSEVRAKSDPSGLALHATVPTGAGEISAEIRGGPVTLSSLGIQENDFGLVDVAKAKLEAAGKITLSADAKSLTFQGDGHANALSIVHRALAEEPVHGLDLAFKAAGFIELDGSLVRIDEGKLELGAIQLQAFGSLVHTSDYLRVDVRANVPVSDCQKMFNSIPAALVPKLAGMGMNGSFSLDSRFALDTRHPDDLQIEWSLKNRCHITNAPPEVDVARFTKAFRHKVYDEHGQQVEVVTGPGTEDWVPLSAISPFLEAAVTTTEDGGFRFHEGFDRTAITNSIRDNLRAGKFLRGASTITMQLAKNLYLERQKNLSRKLQEAVLTTYLEQALTKDQILELYFNIVEFGPMIYGIGPAADHYFDTSPNDLSLGQALFLSSILPAPKRTYFAPTGQVSKGWLGYLHKLMKIMRDRKKINDEELVDGVSEVITYRVARSPRVRPTDWKRDVGGDMPFAPPEGP